jgi:hypothetical protein
MQVDCAASSAATHEECSERAANLQQTLAGTIDDAGYRPVQITCMYANPERRMKPRSSAIFAVALLGLQLPAFADTARSDMALVLAVDVSGSVDDDRFKLQREGIAAALESDDFSAAIAGVVNQTIEIAVIEWAEEQRVVLPWTVIHGHGELAALAGRLRRAGRSWVHTMTDPGGGIAAAERLLAVKPLVADRQVIDVSGDGRQNTGDLSTANARDAAVSHGITLNGLPITSGDDPDVDGWYRANVIGGPGAFLIVANGYDAFAEAFRQKLTLEVAGLAPDRKAGDRLKPAADGPAAARLGKGRPEGLPKIAFAQRCYCCFTANTQTTPPWGTLSLTPRLPFASASWMRWASTPQPD